MLWDGDGDGIVEISSYGVCVCISVKMGFEDFPLAISITYPHISITSPSTPHPDHDPVVPSRLPFAISYILL